MKETSLKGYFLVSSTSLKKSYFAETVILLIENNDSGSFGLIINRIDKARKNLGSLAMVTNERMKNIPLYEGGPVEEDSLFLIHNDVTVQNPGEEILPDIFWGSGIELFQDLLERPLLFNVYRGYVGWMAGQLENEIKTKSWIVLPPSNEMIFHDDSQDIYRETLKHGGDLYLYFADKVRNPLLN